jgi:hypothetical protein
MQGGSVTPVVALSVLGLLLGGSPHVISWGWFQITLANLVVIVLMIATFVAAMLVPFPKAKE